MTSKVTPKISEQERVYHELREGIMTGMFLPGEKLTEEMVARTYETSRSTIRLCLSMLERDGIVTLEPRRGFMVSKISIDEALELLEARSRIESYVGRLAARKITEVDIEYMEFLLQEMSNTLQEKDYDRYSLLNTEFHGVIYRCASNKGLEYVSLQLKTKMIRLQYKIAYIRGRPERSIKEHSSICEALKRKDEIQVENLIKAHIEGIRDVILENYGLLEA